jgi:hypothetical protein
VRRSKIGLLAREAVRSIENIEAKDLMEVPARLHVGRERLRKSTISPATILGFQPDVRLVVALD